MYIGVIFKTNDAANVDCTCELDLLLGSKFKDEAGVDCAVPHAGRRLLIEGVIYDAS